MARTGCALMKGFQNQLHHGAQSLQSLCREYLRHEQQSSWSDYQNESYNLLQSCVRPDAREQRMNLLVPE